MGVGCSPNQKGDTGYGTRATVGYLQGGIVLREVEIVREGRGDVLWNGISAVDYCRGMALKEGMGYVVGQLWSCVAHVVRCIVYFPPLFPPNRVDTTTSVDLKPSAHCTP